MTTETTEARRETAAPTAGAVPPAIELRGISKAFGPVQANKDIDIRVERGTIHGIIGENGAGKSTLIKAITGSVPLTAGAMLLDGVPVRHRSPRDGQAAGISVVHQELELLPNLSVAENLSIGHEPRRGGRIDWRRARRSAAAALDDLGIRIDPASLLGAHPRSAQQLVAIARAVAADARVLVLDEPTARLEQDAIAELFRVVLELRDRGVAILFVSHFLDQVYEVCDRVTVLREGRWAGEHRTREVLRVELLEQMTGSAPAAPRPDAVGTGEPGAGMPHVVARAIVGGRAAGIDLELAEGEIVGLVGAVGSGRTALARRISGVERPVSGTVQIAGVRRDLAHPRDAIALGVVYASEDRRAEGIVDRMSVADNIVLALQAERGTLRPLSRAQRDELAESWIEALAIKPADPSRPAGTLSSGNQQKVLLARLLCLSPRVLILDEPTRGIDAGAKSEVQHLVEDLAANGVAVLFISAEPEEVVGLATRVVALRDGLAVGSFDADGLTVESLLAAVAESGDD